MTSQKHSETKEVHIIAITEAKPKNARFPMHPADYKLDGYQTFSRNLTGHEGRGIILYAQDWMDVKEVHLMMDYQESLWVEVKTGKKGGKLLCGIVYRSPSQQTEEKLKLLIQLIQQATDKKQQVLIMGDFNFPHIDWNTWTPRHHGQAEREFLTTCMDGLLTQHVREPTRGRFGQNPNILDLVFTQGEEELGEIEFLSPLGKSDHVCMLFNFLCPMSREPVTRKVFLYDKADYEKLRQLDWATASEGRDTEEDYKTLCKTYEERCNKHIPQKIFAAGERRKKPGVTSEVAKIIKKKHRCWTRFMETRTEEKYKEYTRARNNKNFGTKSHTGA